MDYKQRAEHVQRPEERIKEAGSTKRCEDKEMNKAEKLQKHFCKPHASIYNTVSMKGEGVLLSHKIADQQPRIIILFLFWWSEIC